MDKETKMIFLKGSPFIIGALFFVSCWDSHNNKTIALSVIGWSLCMGGILFVHRNKKGK